MTTAPKATSYSYGEAYQLEQVEKHRHRRTNHWQPRIALAHDLIDRHVMPRLGSRLPGTINVVDIGCSIGTMAIEMALRGFKTYGVDFDASALTIARDLALEENVSVEFVKADVAEWRPEDGRSFDIAVCFDIFEHLHDDELGGLLQAVRRQLSPSGALVFYTFPLQYDYLFFSRDVLHWPLWPFTWLSPRHFERLTRAYASVLDAGLLLWTGESYRERIRKLSHCNPTTKTRLEAILTRAGYDVATIETRTIYPFQPHVLRRFGRQPVAHRNLFGVAYPAVRTTG
jgi:2-polyprenyl-3-methyl-5-hydroxy-6-metoxy-1,4-benzoquinol methylase